MRFFALTVLSSMFILGSGPAAALDAKARVDIINRVVDRHGVAGMAISPDGKHLVAIDTDGKHNSLTLIDVESGAAKSIFHGARVVEGNWTFNKEPVDVTWVTDDILAVDYGVEAESIDLEGRKIAEIGRSVIGKASPSDWQSTQLLVHTDIYSTDVALVDAKTGDRKKFHIPMSGTAVHWVFDKKGMLRAVTMSDSAFWKDATVISNWYKPEEGGDWVKLAEFKITDEIWVPVSVADTPDSLIVSSGIGRDTRAVFLYDAKKREFGRMLVGYPDEDILDVEGTDPDAFRRVESAGMKPRQHWLDPAWAKVQASIDLTLPGRINRLSGDPKNRILIYSYGDVDPGRWYLMDVVHMSMSVVGEVRPTIDPGKMLPMEIMSYAAPDGLKIPAYLTKPAKADKPMPMVVLIHGGPTVRDTFRWNPEVQVLAANGYVVFQPQFRGSGGFGRKFEEAGYHQWGLAMQDDITAGVEYLIKQGVADPGRICIYGASYGGYAALWGMVKTPELYRCGISYAGVSDIGYMLRDWSDRNSNEGVREIQRFRIGDPNLNAQQFDEVSPVKHADRIVAPILIMHGARDARVPISHSEKMIAALKANNKTYEWHELAIEGHGLYDVKDQAQFYATILRFLDKHIGPGEEESAVLDTTGSDKH